MDHQQIAGLPDSALITTTDAAEYLSVRPKTLIKWRHEGHVPLPYVKMGAVVRYRMSDLRAFADVCTRSCPNADSQ
jgi:excisionase family DNA binding protein